MSRATSPTRPAGLEPEQYTQSRLEIEYRHCKSQHLILADTISLRKAIGLRADAYRRLHAVAESLKDIGIEYNSTYSSMGNVVDAAWATHPLYDTLVGSVIKRAEQRYEIGRALSEYEFYQGQVIEIRARLLRRRDQQLEIKTEIETLTQGKGSIALTCICEVEAPDPVATDDALSLARRHQNLSSHSITNDIFEWLRMQQKLVADSSQMPVPESMVCAHGREGPRRPSTRALSGTQTPNLESLPLSPSGSSLTLSTSVQRLSYRAAALNWRDSPEFQAVLDGHYSQMKINGFPEPPNGNLIKHACPPDPFWPFVNCCRCDVREFLFWQSDFPKCLPLFRRAFNPLRFAVECSKDTRDELARYAKAVHATVEGMERDVLGQEEMGLTLLK